MLDDGWAQRPQRVGVARDDRAGDHGADRGHQHPAGEAAVVGVGAEHVDDGIGDALLNDRAAGHGLRPGGVDLDQEQPGVSRFVGQRLEVGGEGALQPLQRLAGSVELGGQTAPSALLRRGRTPPGRR